MKGIRPPKLDSVYRQHFYHIPSWQAIIIHYSLAILFQDNEPYPSIRGCGWHNLKVKGHRWAIAVSMIATNVGWLVNKD